MSDFTINHSVSAPSLNIFAKAGQRVWNTLVAIGENSARAQSLNSIAALSDADLEKMGVTRKDLIERALGGVYWL